MIFYTILKALLGQAKTQMPQLEHFSGLTNLHLSFSIAKALVGHTSIQFLQPVHFVKSILRAIFMGTF